MALVTAAEVLAWVQGDGQTPVAGYDSAVVTVCCAAAGDAITDYTSRLWEKSGILAEYFDGDDANGADSQVLLPRRFPVYYNPPTDAITVTENGVALVVAQGYSTSADVIVANVGLERRAKLIRTCGSWSPGVQNILVTYKAGFDAVPERIKFVAKELAWLTFTEGRKTGVDAVTIQGSARTLVHSLSAMSQSILVDARRY